MYNELTNVKDEKIKNLIYNVRGKQVMLDSDVAILYKYETKRLNEVVKRNKERFPENFCFKLNKEEYSFLKSQIATSNEYKENRGGKQKMPYVYTERGIIMMAGLLKSEIAIDTSIKIVEAFVTMKHIFNDNRELLSKIISIENEMKSKFQVYDKQFEEVFNALQKHEELKQRIFFEGQIYDAYNLIIEIIKTAREEIVIIDNYIDETLLSMLSKKEKNVRSDNCNQ